MALDKYQSMRDFERTAEPSAQTEPEISEHEARGEPRFVVQEHHATALHWDFRLERGGVLVSWALPKGVPPDPRVNNMAVHTEDHPLGYYDFEGEIPKGEYGGGMVYLWDTGTYEELKWSDREVMIVLNGQRTHGKYVLFRAGEGPRNWMIHRMDPPEDATRELMPEVVAPLTPEPGSLPDSHRDRWRWMASWGGVLATIAVEGGRCTARTSDGTEVTKRWPELGAFGRAVGALPVVFVAELVRPTATAAALVMLADVVWLDGHPTSSLDFATRRRLLEQLELDGDTWKTAPLYDDAELLLDAVTAQGLPGIVGDEVSAPYRPARFVAAAGRE